MDAISHRRFFNITGLIGVRVEDAAVFEATHALIFDLVDSGIATGLRVDHVDGLADPGTYLRRLRDRLPDTPVWVEKILTGDEAMPGEWPTEGTTGYEAARQIGRVLTRPEGLTGIDTLYRDITGRTAPFHDVLADARRQILLNELSAELWSLGAMVREVADSDPAWAELGPEAIREALIAFLSAFPRYRTYATEGQIGAEDRRLIEETVAAARPATLPAQGAVERLGQMLLSYGPAADRLRQRIQQVTGAAAAKSLEDTAFYREFPLLSLNEVGGEPDDGALSPAEFGAWLSDRLDRQPAAMTLSSSHDTKRSEDSRARLIAGSWAPDAFSSWIRSAVASAPEAVGANTAWYIAQSRFALADGCDLPDRLADHVTKALREGKERTFHIAPDDEWESICTGWAREIAARPLTDFGPVDEIEGIAADLSLAQVAIKCLMPGIPDIYRGTERVMLALTDPDNRRAVDFDALAGMLDDPGTATLDARKVALTRQLLHLRRDHPDLFARGAVAVTSDAPGTMRLIRSHGTLRVVLDLAPGSDVAPGHAEGDVIWPPEGEERTPVRITLAQD